MAEADSAVGQGEDRLAEDTGSAEEDYNEQEMSPLQKEARCTQQLARFFQEGKNALAKSWAFSSWSQSMHWGDDTQPSWRDLVMGSPIHRRPGKLFHFFLWTGPFGSKGNSQELLVPGR